MTWLWPLKNCRPLFPDKQGAFACERRHDVHTGIDLYCEVGTEVLALEDGKVISIEGFTGEHADDPSPWWRDTKAILVEGASGVVAYGEVCPLVEVGQPVHAGDTIGTVVCVLLEFKGRPMTMLHIELLKPDAETAWWKKGEPRLANLWKPSDTMPDCLLDPTRLLEEAAKATPFGWPAGVFNMATYDPALYRGDATPTSLVFIKCQGQILLLRRTVTAPNYPLYWAVPGGMCEEGETPEETALRELKEESGLEGKIIRKMGVYPNMVGSGQVFHLHTFEAEIMGDPQEPPEIQVSEEHDDYRWIPIELIGPVTRNLLGELLSTPEKKK